MSPPAPRLHRLPDWAQRLTDLVAQRLDMPFAWGSNDCVSFVADALLAMHGQDLMAEFRTQRCSQRQAWLQLRAGGGIKAGLARAGLVAVPPSHAELGDVVQVPQGPRGRQRVLALCNGPDAMAPGQGGLLCLPMSLATAAWRA